MIQTPTIKTLPNGLKVCLIPFKGLQSTTLHLKGRAGSLYEMDDEIGVAHVLEHMVLQKTKRFESEAAAMHYLARFGGKFVAVTSRESVLFMAKVLNKDIEAGLDLLHEIFNNPIFDQNTLEIQKKIVLHEINRYKDIPEKMIGRVANKILYPGHRLGELNSGNAHDIEKITLNKLERFYDRLYNASNFVLCICGDFDENKVFGHVEKKWQDTRMGIRADLKTIDAVDGLKTQAFVDPSYARCQLEVDYQGYTLHDSKAYASMFLGELYNSYTNTKIKNERGLAYKIGCESFSAGTYGKLSFSAASKEISLKKIVGEFKKTIDNTAKILKPHHLITIRNQLEAQVIFAFEKPSARAEFYSENLVLGREDATHLTELKGIRNVTRENILKISKEIRMQEPKITVFSNTVTAQDLRKWWN